MLSGTRQAVAALNGITEGDDAKVVKGKSTKRDILKILGAQKSRSIGFDNDKELNAERADALDYYKGKHEGAIARDLPALPNRSAIVSTDVANGIEMAIPDILAVFTDGDDPLTFKPQGLEDVEQAKQETDYVRHIIFSQNDGWQLLYTGVKDALISKTGVFHFYWDDDKDFEEYTTTASEPQIEQILEENGGEEVERVATNAVSINGFPIFDVTFKIPVSDGHVAITTVPPEDFTVSPDTVKLKDTEYCAMRSKVSRQWLIEQGYDEKDVLTLEISEIDDDERQARDTAEENTDEGDEGSRMLEMVDIVTHYIRIDLEGTGKRQIWRVVTGNDEGVELEREKRSMIEFAALTPFPMPHRFYGQSLADKLMQTQKWKTTVTRQVNDHLYFANNQRQEVKKAGIVPDVTIPQLVNNAPGQPVVTEDGNSLRPIQNGSLGIDALGLLEHISADAELRSGVMRYGSGVNADSLHETKGGSDNQLNAAKKRAKLMARLFAETGIKDLFLGVHDIARQNATMEDTVELRGAWTPVAPGSWRRRKDMTIDTGIGSSGTEEDLIRQREWRGTLQAIVQAQGGMQGPLMTEQNIYNSAMSLADRLRIKDATLQLTNPEKAEEAKKLAGNEDKPEVPPEVQAAQMEMEIEKQTQAARIELETQKAETQAKIDMAKAQQQAMLDEQKLQAELKLETMRSAAKLQIEREAAEAKMTLDRERATFEAQLARDKAEFEADLAEKNAQREARIAAYSAKRDADNDKHEIAQNRPGGSLAE